MPSLTVAGMMYITGSYLLRGWQERITEQNMPRFIRSQLMGYPMQRVSFPTPKTITVRIRSNNVTFQEREVSCGRFY